MLLCKNKFPLKDKSSISHSNQCQGDLCPMPSAHNRDYPRGNLWTNCKKTHSKGNPTHKTNSLKTFVKSEPNRKPFSPCTLCGDNNLPLFNCIQCKGNLCNKCGNGHYLERSNHKISLIKLNIPKEFKFSPHCK